MIMCQQRAYAERSKPKGWIGAAIVVIRRPDNRSSIYAGPYYLTGDAAELSAEGTFTVGQSGSLLAFFGVTSGRLLRLMGLDASTK